MQSALSKHISLDQLWELPTPSRGTFTSSSLRSLPEAAQRYLRHSIAPNTPLASAVRLQMHGEIKLKNWLPFTAEQVIRCDHNMIWKARVSLYGLPITGFDQFLAEEGAVEWKLFGLIPLVSVSGPDITRSALGRVEAESVWLPSVLCNPAVSWAMQELYCPQATFTDQNKATKLDLQTDASGRLHSIHLERWGNPGGGAFHETDFGGLIEEEATFEGYTIPTRLKIGWHFRNGRFDGDGEFFRVTIDNASFR